MVEASLSIALYLEELRKWVRDQEGLSREDFIAAINELADSLEETVAAEEELENQSKWLSRAMEDAERERRRYRELFEFAPDGYLVTDRFAMVREANRAAFSMLGTDEAGLLGRPLASFCEGHSRKSFMTYLLEVRGSKESPGTVVEMRSHTGYAFPVYIKAIASREGSGEVTSMRWLLRDFTERQLIERRLAEAKEKLERYTSTVSHDLKGPVSGILLGMQYLREDLESSPGVEDRSDLMETIEAVENNARKSYELIVGLLDNARSEAKIREGAPIDVNRVVNRIADDLTVLDRGASSRVEVVNDLGFVTTSELELYQVFVNLINNSIVHGGGEGIVVSIERAPEAEGNRFLVRDNGVGFPRFMIDGGSGEGLGMGLSIVQRIARDNGGWMRLSNDGGAVVEVLLREPDQQPGELRQPDRTMRVLVVEDEPGTAYMISKLLRKSLKLDVDIALDLHGAYHKLASDQYDLITLDYKLPDGYGSELMEHLASNPGYPPVIVVTGQGDEKLAASFLQMGALGYVIKDAEMPAMLKRAVERAIKGQAGNRLPAWMPNES